MTRSAYVIPNSLEEYSSDESDSGDNGGEPEGDDVPIGPKMDVTVRNRYHYDGPKEGTDRISTPTWTVNFQTPTKDGSDEDALAGAELILLEDMRTKFDYPPASYPSFDDGPKPVIRDRTRTTDDITEHCSNPAEVPSFEKNEPLLFDATDTAVHRQSYDPFDIEWTLWRRVNCANPENEDQPVCDSTPENNCVRDYSRGWEEIQEEQQTGWTYSNSLADPGRYKVELITGDNTTYYEFRIGHAPMPRIRQPSSNLNRQLVGEDVALDGTVSYQGEEELTHYWIVPESVSCSNMVTDAPHSFGQSSLGEPGVNYKAVPYQSATITFEEHGVYELYYFVTEGDEDRDGTCDQFISGKENTVDWEDCQWNVDSTTVVAMSHSGEVDHTIVDEVRPSVSYEINRPGVGENETGTISSSILVPQQDSSSETADIAQIMANPERILEADIGSYLEIDASESYAYANRSILGYHWDIGGTGRFVDLQPMTDDASSGVLEGVLGDNVAQLPQDESRFEYPRLFPVRFMVYAQNPNGPMPPGNDEPRIEAQVGELVVEVGDTSNRVATIRELPSTHSRVSEYLQRTFGSASPPMVSDGARFFTARGSALAEDATAFRWKFEASHVDFRQLESGDGAVGESDVTWDVSTGRPGPVFYEYDFDERDEFEVLLQIIYPDGRTTTKRCTVTGNGLECKE
ncbi:hypothetical protein [Haloarchaeobius iranensis]|nr:hypothetical protein [Haloarchaeobius iranensis]